MHVSPRVKNVIRSVNNSERCSPQLNFINPRKNPKPTIDQESYHFLAVRTEFYIGTGHELVKQSMTLFCLSKTRA